MPKNKADKKENQQNHAAFEEDAITLKSQKASVNAPNLNGINKNEQ